MISCGKCWKKTQPGVSLEFQQRGTPGFGTTGISSGMDIIIFAASISSPNSPYNWQVGNLATDGCVFLWVWWKMIIILLRWLTSKLQILSKWPSLSPLLPRSLAKIIIYIVRLRDVDCSKWGRTKNSLRLVGALPEKKQRMSRNSNVFFVEKNAGRCREGLRSIFGSSCQGTRLELPRGWCLWRKKTWKICVENWLKP